jgi:hypothetical protein
LPAAHRAALRAELRDLAPTSHKTADAFSHAPEFGSAFDRIAAPKKPETRQL